MAKQTLADVVAAEINDWIERTSDAAAQALLDSVYAPDVVQPPTAELLAYYRSPSFQALLWNPDGTPNTAGRGSLVAQVGEAGYRDIAKALAGTQPLTPVATPHPTNTTLALGQLPDPTQVPALATPGGA